MLKKKEKTVAVVAKATVFKQGSVQCFKFISGLELSVG
jgi:alpha-tubulin suppressor-like RCC1 family protein